MYLIFFFLPARTSLQTRTESGFISSHLISSLTTYLPYLQATNSFIFPTPWFILDTSKYPSVLFGVHDLLPHALTHSPACSTTPSDGDVCAVVVAMVRSKGRSVFLKSGLGFFFIFSFFIPLLR